MTKTYVSVLNLLSEVTDILEHESRESVLYGTQNHLNHDDPYWAKPFTVTEKPSAPATEENPFEKEINRLFPKNQGDAKSTQPFKEIRQMAINCHVWNVSLSDDQPCNFEIPYFLEMEFIKGGEISFTEQQLDMLEQMLIWFLGVWMVLTKKFDGFGDMLYRGHGSGFIEKLKESDMLIDLDIEKEPERMKDIIWNAYKQFPVLANCSNKLFMNLQHNDYGAPVSSLSAFQFLVELQYDRGYRPSAIYQKYPHYIPWIIIFFLLECETKQLKSYTYQEYKVYRNLLDTLCGISDIDIDHGGPFSYGYDIPYGGSYAGDVVFMHRIITHILKKLEEFVSCNVSTVSINDSDDLKDWSLGSISVRLDKATLEWEGDTADGC